MNDNVVPMLPPVTAPDTARAHLDDRHGCDVEEKVKADRYLSVVAHHDRHHREGFDSSKPVDHEHDRPYTKEMYEQDRRHRERTGRGYQGGTQ